MLKNIGSFLLILTICALVRLSFVESKTIDLGRYSTKGLVLDYTVKPDVNIRDNVETSKDGYERFTPYLGKSFVGFKEALAFKESGGDYAIINSYGYLGKYQFGKETLRLIGVKNVQQFLNNPKLQEKAFVANAQRNKWILRRDINNFVGKRINGVVITESGILAAAHLAGAGSVKKYLRSYGLDNFADGYGTTVENYIKKFSGYDMSMLKANKKARVNSI
ncbi:MAG: peptidoglycan-binding protein LysM [Jejuia sp.]